MTPAVSRLPVGALAPKRPRRTAGGNRPYLISTAILAAVGGLLAGCATSGPNHTYVSLADQSAIHDVSADGRATVPALAAGETAIGLAYDFNTDHLFVRVLPADVIRVIERPSGKVLREMPLTGELRATQPGDLAIRSRDRHLFVLRPDGASVAELTVDGAPVRTLPVAPGGTGLAFDQARGQLLVLANNRVLAFDESGRASGAVELRAPVSPTSLGFDSAARHFFVPLVEAGQLGEFDEHGTLLQTHAFGPGAITAIDAGQRSFVRVF